MIDQYSVAVDAEVIRIDDLPVVACFDRVVLHDGQIEPHMVSVELNSKILASGLDQYRAKMRASFVRMGKAVAQAHRSRTIEIPETPELNCTAVARR